MPASLCVHLGITAPIDIWAPLMAFALNQALRRDRLARHGLDPNLVEEVNRTENGHIHATDIGKSGPPPDEAKCQSNSRVF